MALVMQIPDPADPSRMLPSSYWYVTRFEFDADEHRVIVALRGYASESACNAGGKPLDTVQIVTGPAEFATFVADVWPTMGPIVYARAAADPFFASAEVV